MSLLQRIERARPRTDATAGVPTLPDAPAAAPTAPLGPPSEWLRDVKRRLQDTVMRDLDAGLDLADPAEVRRHIETVLDRLVNLEGLAITRGERVRLLEQATDEVIGLGPIEPLLRDESISEVMVNGPKQIYIERAGRLERADVSFANDEHVMRIIDRIIAPIGRRIDESSPTVDARLADGSRVNAIIPPLSLIGPVVTIRKFATRPFTVDDLIRFGTATPEMFEFLKACVEARLNIFVSGGTGSGKTTTLNVLSSFIPDDERIVTIEDAAELQLRQRHVITLEARPANLEGLGQISIRELLRNALHMRPDRIIVGECRAGEALDMLQAMNTGQDGSLSTGHANSPRDMLARLETMVLMTGYDLPLRAIREQMSAAVDLIVHTARLKDGSRKVVGITEVLGMDDDDIVTQDVFLFEQRGVEDGRVVGDLKPTGIRPKFAEKLKQRGVELPADTFGELIKGKKRPPPTPGHLLGFPEAISAGGMVYLSGMGPIDPETGEVVSGTIQEITRRCLQNIQARLESAGSSLDKVVWAYWALRNPAEFESFFEEWSRWFPDGSPARYGTLIPAPSRKGALRISVGVIAQGAGGGPTVAPGDGSRVADAFGAPAPARTPGPR